MIKTFFEKLRMVFKDKSLTKKILFVLGALLLFRFLAAIPVPGVDQIALQNLLNNNQFFGLLNILSGGGFSALSVVMLGVSPYITASIIMQVLTMVSDKLRSMYKEEGNAGRQKFMQISRFVTVPIALVQGFGFLLFLQQQGVVHDLSSFELIVNVISITAGSMLLMWIGELISEFGIGNGVSLIIFAGIVSGIPSALSQIAFTFSVAQIPTLLAFIFIGLVIIVSVVYITEAERPIPITYARQVRGGKNYGGTSTYLPLRLNQAGVIPIIFALSLLLMPQMVINFLVTVDNATLQNVGQSILNLLSNQWFYGIAYFLLVFLFTYFYTAVTFDPDSISDNLQKSGAFIPGVRPGESTSKHIGNIIARLTLVGGLFLGFIAVLPTIVQGISGITALTIGGTSLLIAVSVIIDLLKKTEAQITMREY